MLCTLRLRLRAQHSTGTLREWPHGEPGLCCHVQLGFLHPGGRLKGELLHQAREEDEELHSGKAFSNAVSPPCDAKSTAVCGLAVSLRTLPYHSVATV